MFDTLRGLQSQEFDLDELVRAVNRQTARAGMASADERVAAQLDARTVRYYQSLGLVSKPDRYQGRQAVYSYQHLLQLVAVKALQAQGLRLGQIKGWLPDQPVAALQAALAGSLAEPLGRPAATPLAAPARRPPEEPEPEFGQLSFPLEEPEPAGLAAFRLAPGVELLLDPGRVADPVGLAKRLSSLLDVSP